MSTSSTLATKLSSNKSQSSSRTRFSKATTPSNSSMKGSVSLDNFAVLKKSSSDQSLKSAHSAPILLEKHVLFGKIEIREYERVVSDHPAVSSGPAVGIGWQYDKKACLDVDQYEDSRPPRRVADEFRMPPGVRVAILKEHTDVQKKELQQVSREAEIVKRQRRSTVATMELEGAQVAMQSAVRKLKRLIKVKPSSKKEQELLWQKAAMIDTSDHGGQELNQKKEPIRSSISKKAGLKNTEKEAQDETTSTVSTSDEDEWEVGEGK